jgi:hypothetical protein
MALKQFNEHSGFLEYEFVSLGERILTLQWITLSSGAWGGVVVKALRY